MRLRKEPEPSPEVVRELAAVDAVLAGEPLEAEYDELRDLALALREERPKPRPEFALGLDLRAREGFSRERVQAPPARRPWWMSLPRRSVPLALGTAAALFIVVTAVLSSGVLGGGGDDGRQVAVKEPAVKGTGRESQAPAAATPQPQAAADSQAAGGSSGQALAPPSPGQPPAGVSPQARRRQVERSASVTLSTPSDRVEDVADGVVRVTDRYGGFVLSSSVSSGEGADTGASLELRIPTTRLQAAVADLSELAHVRSRTQAGRDITSEFSSPRRRLADALAERRGVLRRLAQAATPNETAAVRARLRAVNRRIDRNRATLRSLRERVSFSAVAVSVEPGGKADGNGGWTIGDAARDALSVLGAVAGATIVAIAVALPAGILALGAWLAYRALARRRRERALDLHGRGPIPGSD
jgi:hypothetical protein